MSRIVLSISTFTVLASLLVGSSAGQDPIFRYDSDPLPKEAANSPIKTQDSSDEEKENPKNAYESYESWPSGGKSARQEKAIFRARQRELRIASRKWYGYSASRPTVYGNPHFATYMVGAYSGWGSNFWAPNWYSSNLNWYYPRTSNSQRWIAVPPSPFYANLR